MILSFEKNPNVQSYFQPVIKDEILPSGSTVILTGLADGSVLWEILEGRKHPLGEYRQDMDYPSLYGYLECLEVSPCMGWMSSNDTLRMVTTDHARKLSRVAQDIAETESYQHFDMMYYDFDIRPSIELWERFSDIVETQKPIKSQRLSVAGVTVIRASVYNVTFGPKVLAYTVYDIRQPYTDCTDKFCSVGF